MPLSPGLRAARARASARSRCARSGSCESRGTRAMRREDDEPAAGAAPATAGAAADAVARRSYGKLVAFLASRLRDVAAAEDALSDAFAAALDAWPRSGIPENPEAWLLTVARRKAVDAARRRRGGEGTAAHLLLLAEELAEASEAAPEIPDDRLALMFACAHPAIDPAIRAPLLLQTILG